MAIEQSLKDFENLEMETQHSYASALNSGNFFFLVHWHKSGEGDQRLKLSSHLQVVMVWNKSL